MQPLYQRTQGGQYAAIVGSDHPPFPYSHQLLPYSCPAQCNQPMPPPLYDSARQQRSVTSLPMTSVWNNVLAKGHSSTVPREVETDMEPIDAAQCFHRKGGDNAPQVAGLEPLPYLKQRLRPRALPAVTWMPLYNCNLQTPSFKLHLQFAGLIRIVRFQPLRVRAGLLLEFEHAVLIAFPEYTRHQLRKTLHKGYTLAFCTGDVRNWTSVQVRGPSVAITNAKFIRMITSVAEGSSVMLEWIEVTP
jgi:hypothetical protein